MRSLLLTGTVAPISLTPLTESWPHAQTALSLPAGAESWHAFTSLSEPRLLSYDGSLGDPLAPGLTIADLASDWRLPILLTVPLSDQAVSLAAAYTALAQRARAHVLGVIGVGEHDDRICDALATYTAYFGNIETFSWQDLA